MVFCVVCAAWAISHFWKAAPEDDLPPLSLSSGVNQFKAAGAQGINHLVDMFSDTTFAERHQRLLDKLPEAVLETLFPGVNNIPDRSSAGDALYNLGPAAAPAAPRLTKLLADPATFPEVKTRCAEILGAIGPKAKPAVAVLRAAATNRDTLSQAASKALWEIDRETNVLVASLSNRLWWSGRARAQVLPYFEDLGPGLLPALPQIERALLDSDPLIRGEAEQVMIEIAQARLHQIIEGYNRRQPELLRAAEEKLSSPSRAERIDALRCVAVFGAAASNAAPELLAILQKVNAEIPPVSSNIFGVAAYNWSPPMRERSACLAAICEVGPPAASCASAILDCFSPRGIFNYVPYFTLGDDPVVICRALGKIQASPDLAGPFLKMVLTNSMDRRIGRVTRNQLLAVTAAAALARVIPGDGPALNVLQSPQTNDFATVRILARLELCRLGLASRLPLADIAQEFDPDKGNRLDVGYKGLVNPADLEVLANALGDLGALARPCLPSLEGCLNPTNPIRRTAAIAIRKIDPARADKLGLPGLLVVYPHY